MLARHSLRLAPRLAPLHRRVSTATGAPSSAATAAASTTSTASPRSTPLGEMNVTRHNFNECFADLKADIERASCRFIAIDTEFTGLSPTEDEKERYIDTLEERYKKVKRAGESFLITQFGLSTVHLDETQQFVVKTWNFYVFPRPYGSVDERFLCQASSLQFLSEHGFDFNKFIGDGIPFINLARTETMRQRLERRIENLSKPNKQLSLSADGQAFYDDVLAKLGEWLDSGDARNGGRLLVPARNSFHKMLIHEATREKANYLYSESATDGVEVRMVSKKEREELLAARAQEMRDELDEAIGFSRVIEVISNSKKPVVGHNALLDFVYVFNQFYKPLPETLAEFKTQLTEFFPTIYDTKHLTLRSPLAEKLSSTSLSSLFEYMRANVKPTPENLLSSDPQFEGYRAALKAEGDSEEKLLCHEAGFDAFMTSVCFLGLLAHNNNGELLDSASITDEKLLKTRLQEMETMKNQLNLMISDEAFLDLGNVDQKIDRSSVYHVSTNDRKRRILQVKMESLFEESSKIARVLKESDRDAFVFMEGSAVLKDEAATAEMGVTVVPFEEYHAKRQRTSPFKRQPQSPVPAPPSPAKPEPAVTEGASLWDRCTIS